MLDPDAYTSVPDAFDDRDQVDADLDGYEPRCRVCGCTDDLACYGGCVWVPDPEMLGDVCSACLPAEARR